LLLVNLRSLWACRLKHFEARQALTPAKEEEQPS
jgi:hypothetical protein